MRDVIALARASGSTSPNWRRENGDCHDSANSKDIAWASEVSALCDVYIYDMAVCVFYERCVRDVSISTCQEISHITVGC